MLAAASARDIKVAVSATYFGLLLVLLIAIGFTREMMYWSGRPVNWPQRIVSVIITGILIAFAYGFIVRDGLLLIRMLVFMMPVMLVLFGVLWYWRYLEIMQMRDELDADRIKLLMEARKLGYKGPDDMNKEEEPPKDEGGGAKPGL
ncbi:MAG: hypothetical protein ACREJQ_00240 [bacterium]